MSLWSKPIFIARRAFTLIELMTVLAIIVVLSALGIGASTEMIPRFRTRQAALDFAQNANLARQLAVTSRLETRLLMVDFDNNPTNAGFGNVGLYRIQMGNATTNSNVWDTLPYEDGPTDNSVAEGTVDLSENGAGYLRGVSIVGWGSLTGPNSGNADAIVFSPNGLVLNPSGDFNNLGSESNAGNIQINFINKLSSDITAPDTYTVQIYRGGMVRVNNHRSSKYEYHQGGTGTSTTVN
jgi:prepilin-type N-terminal cleavage/methylation domain-containing protein